MKARLWYGLADDGGSVHSMQQIAMWGKCSAEEDGEGKTQKRASKMYKRPKG